MGRKGSRVSWPQPWIKWGRFEKLGSFSIPKDKMWAPFAGISNLDSGDTFLKLWEPRDFFDRLEGWSWGKEYEKIEGGAPAFNFENKKEKLVLAPQEEINFNVYFYALPAIQKLRLADRNFAGWVDTDKRSYNPVRDTRIAISLQLGTSREYKGISVVYFLCKKGEEIGRGVWGEDIEIFTPERLYEASFKINIEAWKKGEYILRARIFDLENKVIFQLDSPIFTIK